MATETLCFDGSVQIGRRVADPGDDKALGEAGIHDLGSIASLSCLSNVDGTQSDDAVHVHGDRWVQVSGDHEIDVQGSEKYDIYHSHTVNIGMSPADTLELNVYATANRTYWGPVTDEYWMVFSETMQMPHMVDEKQSPDFTWKSTSMGWTTFSFSVGSISIGIKNVLSVDMHLGCAFSVGNLAVGSKLMEAKLWTMETKGKIAGAKFMGFEGEVEGASAEAGGGRVRAEAEADALPHLNPGTIAG